MKKIKFYLGSMWRSYRTKPLIIFLMVFVICMASVFASYVFKVIDHFDEENTYYTIYFNENSAGYQDVISEMEKAFGKPQKTYFNAALETLVSENDIEIMFANVSKYHPKPTIKIIDNKEMINDKELYSYGYFADKDLESDKNFLLIGEDVLNWLRLLKKYQDIEIGDDINFNGYIFELRGVIENHYVSYAIINDKNVPIKMSNVAFIYDKSINVPHFEKLCKRMNLIEHESEDYYGILYGKIFSLIVLFIIFSVNIIILFNHFMRKDRKLYAEYKMLGAKNYEICLAMFFATIPIVLVGSLLGLGIEALVAGSAVIGGTHMYLSALEYFIIGIINVGISLIALLFAAIRRAVKRPVDI